MALSNFSLIMNKIPIIRKGAYKDYWVNGFFGGLILGLLFFLISLIDSSFEKALSVGLLLWIVIMILFAGLGFLSEEYFKRKKKISKLYSSKYTFLDKNNFVLDQDLFFEGEYEGFWFKVIPITKWQEKGKDIEYDIIMAFYTFDSDLHGIENESNLCGDYFLGHLDFHNGCVKFVPKDWGNPNFRSNFDELVSILKRNKLIPYSKRDWEKRMGGRLNDISNKEGEIKSEQKHTNIGND
jgi:hypothetical protein